MAGIADFFFSPSFIIYTSLLFLISNTVVFVLSTLRPKAFPPGPRGLPGLGNLLQVDRTFPFLTYGAWAKIYGNDTPIGVKKGASNVVVLNSARLVRELIERRGAVYSDRPWQFMNNTWIFKDDLRAAIFQNSSPWLTRWRREFNNNFGTAAITKLHPVYEAEAARLLVKLLESPTATGKDLESILVCWLISVPCLGVCGRRPDYMGDHGFTIKEFRYCIDQYAALVAPNVRDLFPVLRYVPGLFGLAEWKERALAVREETLKKEVQQRVRNEVLEVSGGATPKATDVPSLKYTEAFWNEAIPHAPSQDDVYNGHRIPKGTAVVMNVWNIHHSEEDYEEPEKFIPERFLRHPFGMRPDQAHDPAQMEASGSRVTYDFGAGRRICPGMHSAKQSLLLGLAKIVWAFDILPLKGKELDLSLETGFVQEVALHPKNLDVVLKLRNGRVKKDIMDHYYQTYEAEAKVMGWEGGLYK
ncbi:cytochrome P450 [Leptodontidium sp. 2 PMI_412]|nr:cytochrome P450 [Leptodontidium sp. 2 PMI_412]